MVGASTTEITGNAILCVKQTKAFLPFPEETEITPMPGEFIRMFIL